MRIKFLSFIASFFMVSFVITSCLDDDNNIEYSPDATIHAFELDTTGLGKYKFTIDQLKSEIYNEDSLPVHADTIIDKILITKLTTASGVVTMKDQSGKDSIINIADSIDLRKPIKLKVWSTEALAGTSPDQTREYTISVRVHKHDPDSLRWNYVANISNSESIKEQKTVILGENILTYSVVDNVLKVYIAQKGNAMSWVSNSLEKNPFKNSLPSSILSYNNKLYATTADNNDGNVYESTNGIKWETSGLFENEHVNLLLAPLSNKITYIKTINETKVFASTNEITSNAKTDQELQVVPDDFPIGNISYTTYTTATGLEGIMLIGEHAKQPIAGDIEAIVPWDIWAVYGFHSHQITKRQAARYYKPLPLCIITTSSISLERNLNHSIPQKQVLHGKKQIKSSLSLIRTGAKLILSQVKSNRNSEVEKPIPLY